MPTPTEITAVVAGSYDKFKPEVDKAIEVLEQTGITVLEPSKGWLIIPTTEMVDRLRHGQIRPLPTEENLTTREIEDRFLRALGKASLMYLFNLNGYVGETGGFELVNALMLGKPIYALEQLNYEAMEIYDLELRQLLNETVTVLPPDEVADHYRRSTTPPIE